MKIAVVIPSYKVARQIENVIESIPDVVDHIIVVDDECPQNSGDIARNLKDNGNSRIVVIYHEKNTGVGGAVVTGYKKAVDLGCDIVIKMDGDGQMDTKYINDLIEPIINDDADYTKGNRLYDLKKLKSMPIIRLFGNSVLSFLLKISSGYWDIFDPTNGYTAISKKVINELNLENISKRYFFESDMLINLNIKNFVVKDIPIPARYADGESSLKIGKILVTFPLNLFKGFCKRILFKYFIYDFNMASIYMLLGIPMVSFGVIFGAYRWFISLSENIVNTTGTVMLCVLPLILGTQFILQAINIDINSIPKRK